MKYTVNTVGEGALKMIVEMSKQLLSRTLIFIRNFQTKS